MRLLRQVEEQRPASSGVPSASPAYACTYSEGVAPAPGNADSLWQLFEQSARKHGDNEALGWRPRKDGSAQAYEWMTYAEARARVGAAGAAFKQKGITQSGAVGIYASNSPEWMLAMKGVDFCGAKCVPLYDTFGPDAVHFIIEHSGLSVICASSDKLEDLSKALKGLDGQVKQVIVWAGPSGGSAEEACNSEAAKACGVPVMTWDEAQELGKAHPADATPGGADDLCTIMYTSGTTGDPKGVEITHRAVIATVGALSRLLQEMKLALGPSDVFLSYLPLAHIFDRVAEELFLGLGAKIGYWQGSAKTLMDDVGELRPTVFVGVPRIFDRLYSGVTDKVSSGGGLTKAVFGSGFFLKELLLRFGVTRLPGVDDVVFGKIKQRLGGRVRIIVSGGAPLAAHVEHFLKVTMCCPVTQGYGLTETCGASMIADPYDATQATTAGAPLAGLQIRLESIPDMNYDALGEPPQGEVLMRGPAVFSAYHKRDDLTAEVKSGDGWFHTGDVGELLPSGALKIVDRKKNFFKLAHGEYVAAEKLENAYKKVNFVDQIWVYGDSERAQLVAVVVPARGPLTSWAKSDAPEGTPTDLEGACGSDAAAEHVQKVLEQEGRSAGLKGFEIVKRVHLSPEAFSTDNDLLTPSFKLKRPQLKKRFADEIKAMYSTLQ